MWPWACWWFWMRSNLNVRAQVKVEVRPRLPITRLNILTHDMRMSCCKFDKKLRDLWTWRWRFNLLAQIKLFKYLYWKTLDVVAWSFVADCDPYTVTYWRPRPLKSDSMGPRGSYISEKLFERRKNLCSKYKSEDWWLHVTLAMDIENHYRDLLVGSWTETHSP